MTTEPGSSRPLPFLPLIGGVVAVVVGIAVVVFFVNRLDDGGDRPGSGGTPTSTPTPEEPVAAEVLSSAGLANLVAAVEERTGTTKVFDATLYPTYAVLQLPVDRETARQQYFYWDGSKLEPHESFGRSTSGRMDLATIHAETMLRAVRLAQQQVEEPNSWYVIVNAPDDSDPAVLYAYATNKYTEGGYVSVDARGKVVRRVTW